MKTVSIFKKIFKVLGRMVVVIISALRVFEGIGNRGDRDEKVINLIKSLGTGYIGNYESTGYNIRYAFIKNKNPVAPNLFMIHGSPGSLFARETLLQKTDLKNEYNITLIDRPGFGKSSRGEFFDTKEQSEMINSLIKDRFGQYKNIIIGHSQAGQFLPYLGASTGVAGIIMVAGATDPDRQIVRRTSYIIDLPILTYIFPPSVRLTAKEGIYSRPDLTKALSERKKMFVPVIIIQGKKDFLVPYQNATFAIQMMTDNQHELMMYDEGDHFIPFIQPEIIVQAIHKMLDDISIQ